jgi:hypothetical protein
MTARRWIPILLLPFVLSFAVTASAALHEAPRGAAQALDSSAPVQGQNTAGQAQDPKSVPTEQPPAQSDQEKEIQKREQSQRIFGVVPQFSVTSRMHAPALTTKQKFSLFAKSAFDPFEYLAAGLQAGAGQATDSFSGYGQGAEGYGKRYGAALADQVSSNFFANFVYPTLLKEDPRYFRLGEGSIKHRIGYSLAQEFACHTDAGKRSFNWSNVLGAFSSGALSNVYYPQSDRGIGLTARNSAISLLYGSVGGLVDEFWIDIHKKLFRKHAAE